MTLVPKAAPVARCLARSSPRSLNCSHHQSKSPSNMVVCRRALIGLCSAAAIAAALYWYSKSRVLEHRDPDDVKSILNGVVSQLESNRPAEAVVVLDDLLKR